MSFLGIDLGATHVKAAVLHKEPGGLRVLLARRFPPFLANLPAGWHEVDPGLIETCFREVLEELLSLCPRPEGLLLSSQMHGFILQAPDGEPASNYCSWQDLRVMEKDGDIPGGYREFLSRLGEVFPMELGREIRPGLPATLLFWLQRTGRMPRRVKACALPGYLLSRLCRIPPATDPTLASGFGLYDITKGQWHDGVLEVLGLERGLLPDIEASHQTPVGTARIGEVSFPCYGGIGDQQAALLGAGLEEGELSVNIATGSQVSLLSPRLESGDFQVRPYPHGRFLKTITHLPAGRSLNALLRLFSELARECGAGCEEDRMWAYVASELEKVPSTEIQADISFFPSAVGSRGFFQNLEEKELEVARFFLAAYSSMACNYQAAALRLDATASWRGLVLSGGLAQRQARLREKIGSVFQAPLRLAPAQGDALYGLAKLAPA